MVTALLFAARAFATVDPQCVELANAGPPDNYDEQAQQDFLVNYFGLSTTLSPIHAPVPHEGGHGSIGLELSVIPPLGCSRRLVLGYTKTEDTNKSPLLPRPRITFAFPKMGPVTPYAGVAYVPPVPLLGMTNVMVSAELGIGLELGPVFQLGGRLHGTMMKTVGELAPPFNAGDTAFDDLYLASTFGGDLMAGFKAGPVTPYASFGFLDVSTFFYIGDDSVITNNFHPYLGSAFSVGVDARVAKVLRLGGEFYGAPGGYSLPDPEAVSVTPSSRYGHLYTGRFKVAVEL